MLLPYATARNVLPVPAWRAVQLTPSGEVTNVSLLPAPTNVLFPKLMLVSKLRVSWAGDRRAVQLVPLAEVTMSPSHPPAPIIPFPTPILDRPDPVLRDRCVLVTRSEKGR